jgi:SAM-dependent methyltransferase
VKLSIITPLSETGNRYIRETHESLTWQRDAIDAGIGIEWVVVPNHGGAFPRDLKSRFTRIVEPPAGIPASVGALKKFACTVARGDVLIELDHDDILVPGALKRIAETFASPGAWPDFVFSDFAQFHDGSWAPEPFGSRYGWEGYPVGWEMPGQPVRELIAMRAPAATAQNLRRIEWAPNHVRAWRADFYHRIGGHDARLAVADDHDLLIRTFLAGGRMAHVPECLYLYRVHGAQTVSQRNADIQAGTAALYEQHVEALALKFAKDAGLRAIDLCGGVDPRAGFAPADLSTGVDLEGPWPWADGSVGVLRAADALEHMRSPLHVMSEAWRVLAPGGFMLTATPSTEGLGAFCDPTHRSFWNELSFRYYTSADSQRYIAHALAGRSARFAQTLLRTRAAPWDERVKYLDWHGIALKDGYHHFGWCEPEWRA